MRASVVITTTVHANADELQVSTTVESNTCDASASGCRLGTTPPTIVSSVAKPQSALVKSWIDRTSTQPTAGGLELGTWTGPYGDCRSIQCCMAVWSRWLESATRRVGFRALKKTLRLEALYTTKVNNRVHASRASRGTTRPHWRGSLSSDFTTIGFRNFLSARALRCWRRHTLGVLLRGWLASAVSQRRERKHVHRAALRNAMADGSLAPPPHSCPPTGGDRPGQPARPS